MGQTAASNSKLTHRSNKENTPSSSRALGSGQSSSQTLSGTVSPSNHSTTNTPFVQSQRSPVPSQPLGQSSGSIARTNKSPSTTTTQTSQGSSVQSSTTIAAKAPLTPPASLSTRSPDSTAHPNRSAAKTEAASKPSSTAPTHQPTRHGTARIRHSTSSKASRQSGSTTTPNYSSNHVVLTSQSNAVPASQSATRTAQDLSGNGPLSASQSPTSALPRNQANSTGQGSQLSTSAASPSQSAGSTVPTQETPPGHSATKMMSPSQLRRTSLGQVPSERPPTIQTPSVQSRDKETLQSQSPASATTAKSGWTSTSAAPNNHAPAIIIQGYLKSDESPSKIQVSQSASLPTTTAATTSATTSLFNSPTPTSNNQLSSAPPGSKGQVPVNGSALNGQMKDEALRMLLKKRTPGRVM